jgi:hypothetical protein
MKNAASENISGLKIVCHKVPWKMACGTIMVKVIDKGSNICWECCVQANCIIVREFHVVQCCATTDAQNKRNLFATSLESSFRTIRLEKCTLLFVRPEYPSALSGRANTTTPWLPTAVCVGCSTTASFPRPEKQ